MKKLLRRIRQILRDRRTRRFFKRFVGTFAAIVVFVTTYALVLPAITMEAEAQCGIEAHQHDDSCFEEVLVCDLPESDGHQHVDSCYEKVLVCGKESHTHSPACYRSDFYGDTAESTAVSGAESAAAVAGNTSVTATPTDEIIEGEYSEDEVIEEAGAAAPAADAETEITEDINDYTNTEESSAEASLSSASSGTSASESSGESTSESSDETASAFPGETVSSSTGETASVSSGEAVSSSFAASIAADDSDTNTGDTDTGDTYEENTSAQEADKTKDADIESDSDESATDDQAEKMALLYPALTFQDSIAASMGTLPTDTGSEKATALPDQTELTVHVEADEGAFPEGTTMRLSAAEDMDAVASAVEEAVTADDAVSNKTRGFHAVDISFWNNEGVEIEPLKPIRVSITSESIKQAVEDTSTAPVVVHVTDKVTDQTSADTTDAVVENNSNDSGEKNTESIPETEENLETSETKKSADENADHESPVATIVETEKQTEAENGRTIDTDTLTFEAGAFSVYAIVYTVDFEYSVNGKMYQFSLPGGEKIALSDLIEVLGIIDTVTFSDEDLIAVTKVTEETTFADIDAQVFDVFAAGGEEPEEDTAIVSAPDWVLTSLAPFSTEETLTISMKNGDEITIDVTDDQETNLAEFITDASLEIEGKTYGQGQTWNVREGVDYALKLTFKESGSRQFPQGGEEIVMNPKDLGGMTLEPGQSGTFDIPMGLYGTVTGNTWWIDNDGKLHIKFGPDPDNLLTRSNNVYFNLEIDVKFSGTGDTVEFNDRVERDWTANTDTDIKVNKSGYYDSAIGKMVYTVTVTSTGKSTNVTVTDSFANTNLLTLDQGSITISPNKELAESGNSTSASGFTRVISSMSHGETVTITYTADVNEAALGAGGKVTGDDGKNNVKVETEQGKEDEKTNIVNEIKWSDLNKVSTSSEEISDDKIKLSWEIDANTSRTASLVGSTISDRIDWNSKEYMKYVQSDGKVTLHVVGTAADGTTYTKDIQVPVGNNQNQESWSWVVENLGETEGTPLSYKITYDTVAIKQTDNSSVKNDANNSAGGSDSGVGVIPGTNPGGGDEPKINTRKEATEVTADYIDWKIVINVPEEGFPDGLTVTDYIPRYNGIHDGGYGFADRLIGNPEVSGHDYYEWSVSDDYSQYYTRDGEPFATQTLTIEFYKDANKQNKGVNPGAKTITISLRTANDQKWVDYAALRGGGDDSYLHKNNGKVNKTDIYAYGIPLKPEIEKSMIQEYSEGGLPYYTYQVDLSNVTELPVVITDTFDTDYLEFNKIGDDRWDARAYIAAAEQKNLLNGGIAPYAATAVTTEDGIIITANDLPKKDNGHFYEYYRIYYSLKVKDADALAALKAQAIAKGGKYTLHNTAVWGDLSDEFDVDYEVTAVNKEGYFASNNPEERKFTFVIDANPNRFKLGSDGTVELTDQHTDNLSVDYSSVKIYEIPEGVTVSDAKSAVQNNQITGWVLKTGEDVPWNFNGNEGIFYLNDETHYVIVYDAIVIGSGNQKFSNVADLNGFISSKEGEKTYSNNQSAGGEVWEIKLLKYKDGLTSHGLQGATFQLFRGTGEYVQVSDNEGNTWWEEEKEPMKYGDTPTTRANGTVGANITFTTGSDGTVNIHVDQVRDGNEIEGSVHYFLKEIDSPSGYQIDSSTEYWAFTLTKDPDEVNYGDDDRRDEYGNRQWIYFYYNDILKMANTETHEPLDVVVNKTWYDKDGNEITGQNLDATYVATVQLLRKTDDGDYVPVKVEYGTDGKPSTITEVTSSTTDSQIQLKYDNNWSYTWSKLPRVEMGGDKGLEVIHRYAYKIEEVSVDGYVVSLTESETEMVKTYALKNYATPDNKTTDITVNKNWQDSDGTAIEGTAEKLPAEIRFKLYRAVSTTPFTRVPSTGGSLYVISGDDRLVNQEAAEGADDYGVYKLTKTDNWETTFAELPETETTGGTTYYYAYYVKEIPMSGYTTTYTTNGTTRTITNRESLPEGKYISIGLEKKWTDGTNTTPPSGASAAFTVHQQKSTKSSTQGNIHVRIVNDDLVTEVSSLMASERDALQLNFTSPNSWDNSNVSVKNISGGWTWKANVSALRYYTYEVASEDIVDGSITFKFDSTGFVDGCSVKPFFMNTTTAAPTYSEFVDTSWTKTITLPTTAGAWSTTVKDLIQEDAEGNLYRYYLTEDSCTPEASNTVFKDDIGNGTEHTINTSGQKVEVTNTYENEMGAVKVTKSFSGVDSLPTGFQISNSYNDTVFTVGSENMTGTGTADDPYVWILDDVPVGTEVTFTESGATVDGATLTITANGTAVAEGSTTATANATSAKVETGGEYPTATFVNEYEQTTDFGFSKIWKNIGNQSTTWPTGATITVTMNAYTDTSQKAIDDVQVTLSADGSASGVTPAWTATTSAEGTVTNFKVEGLQKYKDGKELHYYVIETQVDGYKAPSYATSEGNSLVFTVSDVPKATNGQQIINTPEGGYELPSTGGPGTRLFTILGSILILGAGVLLWRRRRII